MPGQMRIIVHPRQYGKTTKAVEWLREVDGRVLIVPDHHTAGWMRHRFDLSFDQVMTLGEFQSRRYDPGYRPDVMVDNLDTLMEQVLGPSGTFAGATFNGSVDADDVTTPGCQRQGSHVDGCCYFVGKDD